MPSPNSAAATLAAGSSSRQRRDRVAEHDVGLAAAGLAREPTPPSHAGASIACARAGGHVAERGLGLAHDGVVRRRCRPRRRRRWRRCTGGRRSPSRSSRVKRSMLRRRADHRLRHRVRAEAELVEQLERGRHRVFLVLEEFLQDHLALALELGLGKRAAAHDVAEHAHEFDARRAPCRACGRRCGPCRCAR